MTRRQRLHDATSAVVPTGHTRPDGELSVASLILPPVGAANPKAWGRPLATSHTAVAPPAPVSSVSSHPIEQPAITEALAEVILDELPEEVAERILAPSRRRPRRLGAGRPSRPPTRPPRSRHVPRPRDRGGDRNGGGPARGTGTSGTRSTPITRGGAVGLAHREAVPPVLRTAEEIPIPPAEERAGETPRYPPAPYPDAPDPRAVVDRPDGLLRGPGQADGDGPEVPLSSPSSADAGMPRGQPATRHTSAWAQPREALGLSPGGRG